MIKNLFFKSCEIAINSILALDSESRDKLSTLAGKCVQIELSDNGPTLFLLFTGNHVQVMPTSLVTADIILRGSASAFVKLATQETLNLYQSGVNITGDMGLADELRKIFQRLDLDWEGGLANYTGDAVAHHLGNFARQSLVFTKQLRNNLRGDIKAYLQEEAHFLPVPEEMLTFTAEVTELRDDIDRLEARINLLS